MKQFIELIKELRKTDRGKGILFFAFYFVVFIILFIVIGLNSDNKIYEKEYEPGNEYSFDTDGIVENNYHFIYTITKDDTKYVFDGNKYENTELFKFNNKEYYYDGNKYYVDGKEVEDPYLYKEFININNFIILIENATMDYKTDYQSGNTKYGFLISSNTINSLINNKETDIDEMPNKIIVNTNEEEYVSEINYDLDSYCINNKLCKKNLEINLSYDSFGEIDKIVNE